MKKSIHQNRIVSEQYGVPKCGEAQQSDNRVFRRKQFGKSKQMQRSLEKKNKDVRSKDSKIKYISNCFDMGDSKDSRNEDSSDGGKNKKQMEKRRTSSSPNIQIKVGADEGSVSSTSIKSKNQIGSIARKPLAHPIKKQPQQRILIHEIERLKKEVFRMKSINDILSHEMTFVTRQRDSHSNTIKKMQIKCEDLQENMKKMRQILKKKDQENENLKKIIAQMQSQKNIIIENHKNNKVMRQAQITRIQKDEELQNLIEDIYRNFDDIMMESKISVSDENQVKKGKEMGKNIQIQNEMNKYEASWIVRQNQREEQEKQKNLKMIFSLQERIKYLEVENKMLMRFKYQSEIMKADIEKHRKIEHILHRKIKELTNHQQKQCVYQKQQKMRRNEIKQQKRVESGGENRYWEYMGFLEQNGQSKSNNSFSMVNEESISFQLSKDEEKQY